MAFGDPPPCDHCGERSVVRIVTIVFDAPSPPDQFLCRVHAPKNEAPVRGESGAGAGAGTGGEIPATRTRERHPGCNEASHPKRPSMEGSAPLSR